MSDAPVDTGAASAAPEQTAAPIDAPASPPNPIESSGPEKAPEAVEPQKPSTSVSEAIKRAEAKLVEKAKEAKPAEAKVEAKAEKPEAAPEAKTEARPRDETGKFASQKPPEAQQPAQAQQAQTQPPVAEQPKTPTQFHEAPKRFSDDAKASWQEAPEPVRAEIHRAVKELETGISQYREVVEPLRPYMQLAQQHNTTIDKALENYIGLERQLKSPNVADKLVGLEEVFRHAGISPRDWAAHILNQSPDQVASQQDATIRELRDEIAGLKQQVGGVTQSFQQQREAATLQEVTQFAEAHPRFEDLADDIAFFMKTGRAANLSEAYDLAERLNPAPVKAPIQAPVIPAITADAHTKGSKSISGAPSPGSTPAAKRGPAPSIKEALKRAMAQAS